MRTLHRRDPEGMFRMGIACDECQAPLPAEHAWCPQCGMSLCDECAARHLTLGHRLHKETTL